MFYNSIAMFIPIKAISVTDVVGFLNGYIILLCYKNAAAFDLMR